MNYPSGGYQLLWVAVADVNGDGRPDVLLANSCSFNSVSGECGGPVNKTRGVVGQAVTFKAQVTSTYGTIPDGELVTFYDGKTALGSVKLAGGMAAYTTSSLAAKSHMDGTTAIGWARLNSGVATLTRSTLALGTHPITAQYLGDSVSAKSTSSVLNQVVK